ncbi:unnamed protein product [Symbiodinium sp. CCMP2592]|nr:unnamed protein product [Symbiodinium sp. CCMP2592]
MASSSAAEETSYDLSVPEALLGFLEDAGIRLVRLEYLVELSASGRPLPRRQEAENEKTSSGAPALVESSELKEVRIDPNTAHMSVMLRHPVPRRVQVHLVSISHMWESMQHPDPWRFQLDAIVEDFRPRLLDSVVWIFYDFVSLHQYTRNEEQEMLFRRALRDIFVMYSHDAMEVHRIQTLTPESVRERCVAAHGSKIFVYWKEEQKMMDVCISQLKLNGTPYEERGWCRSEKEWSALREDSEKVFKLQAKVFHQKAESTTNLLIENLDDDKIAVLAAALPSYTKLKELVIMGSPENAWKADLAVVESGACNVEIACENVQDEDAIALAADLSKERCNHLERLHLKCETIGELGRQALEQMMGHRRASLVITLPDCSLGYVAQGIEPAVASETCVTLRILVFKRRPAEAVAAGPAQAGNKTYASGLLEPHASGGGAERTLSVPQPAEAGRPDTAEQTVSVHCLAGSSFGLEVNSAQTGWDVAAHIASRSGHPAETLVLTSGGCVIEQRERLLPQVQHGEITYVVQGLGAGRAATSWQRLLTNKTLSDTDVAALRETVSFTWNVDQSLKGIQLPSSRQSLTFGRSFNQSLEGIQLPSSLQSLTFGDKFNQSLEGIQLPSSLQSLTFGYLFNQSLEGIQLPSSLKSLTFGDKFNQSLEGIQLPSSLQSLTFGSDFNQSLEGIQLPSSLQSLTFGFHFSQILEGIQLPRSLQSLTFGWDFNQSLGGIQLPRSLQSLTFGGKFNQSLEGIQLPRSLQSLTFGPWFNQSLAGIQLPSSLQSLTFGDKFNQSLEGIQLPSSLQSLTFGGSDFNQSLEGIQLPSSLQSLTFGFHFSQSLEGIQLPRSLQSLMFGGKFKQSLEGIQLPSSLQSLTFGYDLNQSFKGIALPGSLQSLTFGYDFNQSLQGIQLPSSLQSLTFGYEFNQSLDGIQLPSSLQSLTFGWNFNRSLVRMQLPSSLQSLTFGHRFNQSLKGIQLPSSLQSLTFGYLFNQSLEGIQLPSSLNSLTFGDKFNKSLDGIQLPSSLQSLTFGEEFNRSLEGIQLPSSLQSLKFGAKFNQSLEGIQLPSSLKTFTSRAFCMGSA